MENQIQKLEWYSQPSMKPEEKKPRNRWIPILTVIALVGAMLTREKGMQNSHTLVQEEVTVASEKIKNPFSFLLLSDLHSDSFGKDNQDLIRTISTQADRAEFIILAGDMVDDDAESIDSVVSLCQQLRQLRPVYYTPGNSELARADWPDLLDKLEALDIPVLEKTSVSIVVHGNPIVLGGLYDYSFALNGNDTVEEDLMDSDTVSFLETMKNAEGFKLTVSHRPDSFYFNESGNYWDMDLVVSGHTHGGQVILPGDIGVWAPDYGWFPEVDSGVYHIEDLTIVVTAGLSSGKEAMPRWNNPGVIEMVHVIPESSAGQMQTFRDHDVD